MQKKWNSVKSLNMKEKQKYELKNMKLKIWTKE